MTKESDSSKKTSPKRQSADDENAAGDNYDLSGDFRGATVNIKSTILSTQNNVRLQNLRDFTVQIRNADDQIVGTGIAVSTDGKIVTCAHVVEAAGINPRNANSAEIGVYFPQARGGEEKNRRATVSQYFPDYDDDVVLLQLTGGSSPLAPEQIAVIGMADESDRHEFRSYGYRPLPPYVGGWADGTIMGSVDSPAKLALQAEPVQLKSQQIADGMSGSGVLDTERNLLVGIVSETYYPRSEDPKDHDIAWSVNARVLSLAPLELTVQDAPLALKAAPQPKTDEQTKQQVVEVAQVTVEQRTVEEKYSWNNAPSVLTEWTGRDHLLEQITADWNDPQKHITGLIGFGGEGKSSLARKWVETLERSNVKTFDGLFWWGFYENKSVDEFLEAALKYMSGGRIDPRQVQSSNLRAQIIGAMLGAGRYLFVLDGLEVMQHQEGDQYGLLQSNDLRDLLTFFARPDNQSFCLITSRAPLLDLMEYTTYTHRDVDRLSEEDGRALFRRLGVKGSDNELNKAVADWDGHALTLSILAAYLAERYKGDIKHLADIPIPTADEPRYERVHRVLRRYDEHLSKDEREFLKLFSVFRLPVQESAFEKVFEPLLSKSTAKNAKDAKKESGFLRALSELRGSKKPIPDSQISNIVNRLVTYRLIRHDEHEKAYTTHPLIRNHYFALFTKGDTSQEKAAHAQIKDYYLSISGDTLEFPTLDDLKPLIEVVHHACQAGAYDDVFQSIFWKRISQEDRGVLIHQLGSYETALAIMFEFFPSGDTTQEAQVLDSGDKRWILNTMGLCLMNLGRLRQAVPFYERAAQGYLDAEEWDFAGMIYQNLTLLQIYVGALDESDEAAVQALNLARRAAGKRNEVNSLCRHALALSLKGEALLAFPVFSQAENLLKEIESSENYLYSDIGIHHADHLRRTGQSDYARRVTEANLQICEQYHFIKDISKCYRVLGDLDLHAGNHASAHAHYDSALKIARSIQRRDVLIEALLAQGRWQAKYMKDANAAFNDLNEALSYCVESGYRIYEADVRVALGWAYLANGEKEKAKESAERAKQMSNEMGYHWGKVDAEEVLQRMKAEG